jgi:Uma2 family endonuclease
VSLLEKPPPGRAPGDPTVEARHPVEARAARRRGLRAPETWRRRFADRRLFDVVQAGSLPRADESDQIVRIHGSWWQYEALLAIRGDAPVPRIAYSDGEIELMSPSRRHERTKSSVGSLVEAYCFERGVYFDPIASTTLKASREEKGVEPDESYAFTPGRDVPDLAIEVVLTSGGLDRLRIYAALGVTEVWFVFGDELQMFAVPPDVQPSGRREDFERVMVSRHLPELTVEWLEPYARREDVFEAVRAFRDSL